LALIFGALGQELEHFLPSGCARVSEQLRLCEANVTQYLRGQGFLRPGERVELEPAGDGNINWVRRVRIFPSGRSFVLKQARPSLERFPEYSVTTERIVFEARYYEIARKEDREGLLPTVLAFDPRERVLILEDLGAVERLDQALSRGDDTHNSARALGFFLARVHAATQGEPGLVERFANDDMCRLHGDHIFFLPFRENSFPLSPRLRARAQELWKDAELVSCADAAYARYRHVKSALVHGDVQAGNVLLASSGPKLLDAEIAHVGDPAFDVGTLLAHLCVNSLASRRSSRGLVRAAWSAYADAAAPQGVRFEEVARYAGLELLRRTLGAARLKAVEQDEAGLAVLETAVRWIRRPPPSLEALASVA
jgi:5-methylthioribose kinase